jgi:hypothetical protein
VCAADVFDFSEFHFFTISTYYSLLEDKSMLWNRKDAVISLILSKSAVSFAYYELGKIPSHKRSIPIYPVIYSIIL